MLRMTITRNNSTHHAEETRTMSILDKALCDQVVRLSRHKKLSRARKAKIRDMVRLTARSKQPTRRA
jgi:hypothetical protein